MLQHGSILVEDDQAIVSSLGDAVAPTRRAATLSEAMGRTPPVDEVACSLFEAVRTLECPAADLVQIDEALHRSSERLLSRYVDDDWTWRR